SLAQKAISGFLRNFPHDLNSLGVCYLTLGKIQAAAEKESHARASLEEAIEAFTYANDPRNLLYRAKSHRELGMLYGLQSEREKASAHLLMALSIMRGLPDIDCSKEIKIILKTLATLGIDLSQIPRSDH